MSAAWISVISVIATCLLYSFACLSFGALLLRLLMPKARRTDLASISGGFLLGSGVLACVIWQLAATAGVFSSQLVLVVLVAVTLGGLAFVVPMLRAMIAQLVPSLRWFWRLSLGWKIIVILNLLLIVRTVAYSFLPPQPLGDAAAFYLVLPKIIAQTGTIQPIPSYEPFVAYTLHGELHYAALMAISTFAAAKMFTVPVAIASMGMLVALARGVGMGWRGQWLAITLLATSTAFIQYIGYGKTDTFSIAMCLAAVYWAMQMDGDDPAAARLTGVFSGLAVTGKISNLAFMPAVILLLILIPYFRKGSAPLFSRQTIVPIARVLVIVAVFAFLILVPHMIKNTVLYRSPFAPFTIGVVRDSSPRNVIGLPAKDEQSIRRTILGYPLFLIYAFSGNVDQISVLALAFIPLIFALPRAFWSLENRLVALLIAGFAGLTLWRVLQPVQIFPRYYLITLIPFMLLVAFAADTVLTNRRWASRFGTLVMASALIALAMAHTDVFLGTTSDFVEQARSYETGTLGECEAENSTSDRACHASDVLNAQAPPGSRVVISAFTSGRYWLRLDLTLCSSNRTEMQLNLDSHAARWAALYREGFDYILHNDANDPFNLRGPNDGDGLPDGMTVDVMYTDGGYSLYKLNVTDPNLRHEKICSQVRPNVWKVVPVAAS